MTISHLDSLAALPESVSEFSNLGALRSSPVLTILAVISWLIPLPAILPPATLFVQSAGFENFEGLHVPAINFTTPAFFKAQSSFDEGDDPRNSNDAITQASDATDGEFKN
jgi:hypothetical protein